MNASTLESDRPLRVLSARLRERLAVVTHATRCLAASGYRVTRQDLRLDGAQRPLLYVANADEALRDDFTQIARQLVGGQLCLVARYLDVDVCIPLHH